MGTGVSKPEQAQEKADLKYLGSRFPFDDAELVSLYRSYFELKQKEESSSSFLSDWAKRCNETNEKTNELFEIVERDILPLHFGERLQRVAFLRPADRNTSAPQSIVKDEDDNIRIARLESFFDGLANCARRGGRAALGTMFQCCVEGDEHPASSKDLVDSSGNEFKARVIDVLDLAYRLALATAFLHASEEDRLTLLPQEDSAQCKALQSLAASCLDHVHRQRIRRSVVVEDMDDSDLEQGFCSKMDFLEWSESTAPMLSSILPTFQHDILFPDKAYPPSLTPFSFPLLNDESAFFKDDHWTLLFSFACMSKSLRGAWHRLYTSESDGWSFNRLQNSLLGYGGPTLVVIQATNGGIFGAFTASKWKESTNFYGSSDCFLYQLVPLTAVYQPTGKATNYMYCNSGAARSRGYQQPPHGIGFGGSTSMGPRLFIAESFNGCIASSQDLTFQSGHLLPRTDDGFFQKTFDIDQLEVWGCDGGDEVVIAEGLASRSRQRDMRAAHIENARKVDKAAFLDDFRTGLIESKAFTYADQIHGSTRNHVLNRDKRSYEYEK